MKSLNPKTRFTKADFKVIPEAEENETRNKARARPKCLVFQGGSELGKTQYAKTFFKNPLVVRHMDKLKTFDKFLHDGIVFDEMAFGHYPRDPAISIFDLDEDSDINVKNSMVTIPAHHPRIFVTNRKMRVIGDDGEHDKDKSFLPPLLNETDTAFSSRIKVLHIKKDLRKGFSGLEREQKTNKTTRQTEMWDLIY